MTRIIPILKKSSRFDKDNERPFSVLSNLEDIKRLYPLLFGFGEQSLTSHVLISIIESIRQYTGYNKLGCGIFIDLKKAFDTVSHAILLTKLNHYGIRGNGHEWFKPYLSHREQFVIVSGHDSVSLS